MKKYISLVFGLMFASQATLVLAAGGKGHVWGQMIPERAEAIRLGGDPVRGEEAFRGCRGCHKSDAAGLKDGTYPRLTGQHASVLVKQMTEIRAGIRHNPKMLPFVEDPAISVQEIADIAAYLSKLESTRENGKGAEDQSARGKKLFTDHKCYTCHGVNGEGNAEKAYPAVAAQHYEYLLREMKFIEKGTRGNAHPDMVKAIAKFSQEDREAVADYLSRLPDFRTVAATASK